MCNNKIIKGNFKRNKVVNNNNIDTVNGNIDQSYIDNSVKNYITIINTATSLMINNSGFGTKYDRYILMALYLRTDGEMNDLRGYVKHISNKTNKFGITNVYIGNVFKDDLYISNHLVIKIRKEQAEELKQGMYISFDGWINKYGTEENKHGVKYGIGRVTNIKVLMNDYDKNLEILNNIKEEEPYEGIIETPINGYEKFIRYIMAKINLKTSSYPDNLFATDYFNNLILTLHFGDNIEKYLLTNQSNYNYLLMNADILFIPYATVLYCFDVLKIYDPYTIWVIVANLYNLLFDKKFKRIAEDNGIDAGEYIDYMRRRIDVVNSNINYESFLNMHLNIEKFVIELIHEFNNPEL